MAAAEAKILEAGKAHQAQKETLVKRVTAVDQSFKSFKEKSRAQIGSLTDNVAEQTKQLSHRIAECERLRDENRVLQSQMAEESTALRRIAAVHWCSCVRN